MSNGAAYSMGPPGPPPPTPPDQKNRPVRAALCALIPGIGAVYNRDYMKAVVHFSVFASLSLVGEEVEIFGLATFAFYLFTIIDAYRCAGMPDQGAASTGSRPNQINLPVWGGLLILMGVVFLLDNLGAISIRTMIRFWPLLLIGLGGYLILNWARRGEQPGPYDRVKSVQPPRFEDPLAEPVGPIGSEAGEDR